jgi:hypothetical protein
MEAKEELTVELRRARGWIIGVGIAMFVFDMIFIYGVYGDRVPSEIKTRYTIYDAIILAGFIALWWFAQYKPKLCCILALCLYWGIQLYIASIDPDTLAKGILIKVLFTLAMIRGLKSAARAEDLQRQLGKVFE